MSSGAISDNIAGTKGNGLYVNGSFQIYKDAKIETADTIYLKKNRYVDIIGALNQNTGYIAAIESEINDNGTKVIKVSYPNSDGEKELYHTGNAESELNDSIYTKKYLSVGLGKNRVFRPGKNVKGIGAEWIIISELYSIKYNKNTDEQVENMPSSQRKFWNEDIKISENIVRRKGYILEDSKHWNTDSQGTGQVYGAGNTLSLNQNLNLYAIWKKIKISKIYIDAPDRYYVVGQNIVLNKKEVLKKVTTSDNLNTGVQYNLKILSVKYQEGDILATGSDVTVESIMSTANENIYVVTIQAFDEDSGVEAIQDMNVIVADTLLQNGQVRFISIGFIDTLDYLSKWKKEFFNELSDSLMKEEGEGIYKVEISYEEIQERKKQSVA